MQPSNSVIVGLGKNESRIYWQLMQMADHKGYACSRFDRSVHKDLAIDLGLSKTTVWRLCGALYRKGLLQVRITRSRTGAWRGTQYQIVNHEIYTKYGVVAHGCD